ncbi:hypothetical protein ES703_105487 [subsurface metagenome]
MFEDGYINLDSLTTRLNLPRAYLQDLVKRGKLPFLSVKGRERFNEAEVRAALKEMSLNNSQERAER